MAAAPQSPLPPPQSYRWGAPADHADLAEIMYAAIHASPSPYTPEQRKAWCPAPPTGPNWQDKLNNQHIALVTQDKPVGFVTLTDQGYLDLAFIAPSAQGQGHMSVLLAMIKIRARILGLHSLSTHASLSAQKPFASLGFNLLHHEEVARDGQILRRAEMRLDL